MKNISTLNRAEVILFLEQCKKYPQDNQLELKANGTVAGYLEPIGGTYSQNDITLLTKWRAANQTWFPSQFNVTRGGTETWLVNQVINNHTKILYMIKDIQGNSIGHLGLAGLDFVHDTCDLDNVIKGEDNIGNNVMVLAEKKMVELAFSVFGTKSVRAQLFDDNLPSKLLQFSLGFKVDKKISMMKRVEDNGVFWDEIPKGQIKSIPAERYFLHMMKYKEMI